MEQIIESLAVYEKRNQNQINEIQRLIEQNFDLKAENTEYAPIKGKIKKLESQNSVLKEKSTDRRRENDMLVEKIQKLQVRFDFQNFEGNLIFLKKTETAEQRAGGPSLSHGVRGG